MRQRGRRSAASLVVLPNVDGSPRRLEPPTDLRADERALFAQLVNACSPRHFVESDLPLLISFCQATLLARNSYPKRLADWERAVRIQALLATRLRLSVQSRVDPKTIARAAAKERTGPAPWEVLKYAKRG
jgi:hypothetical protein